MPVVRYVLGIMLLPFLLGGCATVAYYGQSVGGELDLLARRRPIPQVVADPATPAGVRDALRQVAALRRFATHELHLPDNGTFRTYAALNRPYVVWNVTAAPRFSLRLRTWCFPVAGCVRYRGYFHRAAAQRYATRLAAQGWDVDVWGVPAYSTLGWFADPLPSTVVHWPEFRLAALIFHELAHQELYVAGDTRFDESFAVTVEHEGVRRWLRTHGTPTERAGYVAWRGRQRAFTALVMGARTQLEALYAGGGADVALAAGKARIIAGLRADYRRLRACWGGYAGYDAWFGPGLNNARIGAVVSYAIWVPAFQALLAREGGDLTAFYKAAAAIGSLPPAQREARLRALAAGAGIRPGARPGGAGRGSADACGAGPGIGAPRIPGRSE